MIALSRVATLRNRPRWICFSLIYAMYRSSLKLVQPRPAGRRELKMMLCMLLEPPLHRARLMHPIDVHDEVDLEFALPQTWSSISLEHLTLPGLGPGLG
jgi:hypothetical protein